VKNQIRPQASVAEPTAPGFVQRHTCAVCGADRALQLHRLAYGAADSQGFLPPAIRELVNAVEFHLHRCPRCGFGWTSPQAGPDQLRRLYEATRGEYFEPLGEMTSARARLYRSALRTMRRQGVSGGRLLDLGCGTGEALRSFQNSFGELFGVEPSRFAAERAERSSGARIHVGDLGSAAYPSAFFDAVTAFDVLEHLPEPTSALVEIRRILRPGGVLVIETGNLDSLNARLAAGHWYYVLLPGHVSFFSRRSLSRALAAAGFLGVTSQLTHHGAFGLRYAVGYLRAMARHLAVSSLGPNVLALPFFRSRTMTYQIPFLYDHMLVCCRA